MAKFKDLTGQTFGQLTVIGRAENYVSPRGITRAQWLCRCECGKETIVLATHLLNGNTKSCGCLHLNKFKDLTGQTFGQLTVLKRVNDYVSSKGKHGTRWLCRCTCGNEITVLANSLIGGRTKSCGCSSPNKLKDLTGQTFGRLTVLKRTEDHITSKGKHYVQWLCHCECGNEITVLASSLIGGRTKSCGHCLKIKNEINNMKVATPISSKKNTAVKSKHPIITYNGETHTVSEWAKILDISRFTIYSRINNDLPVEKILSKNNIKTSKNLSDHKDYTKEQITYNGETHSIVEWAKIAGISTCILSKRLQRGLPMRKALVPLKHKKDSKDKTCSYAKKILMYGNKVYTIEKWAKLANIDVDIMIDRIKTMPLKEALFV